MNYADFDTITKLDEVYNAGEKIFIHVSYRPETHQTSHEYIEGMDVVIPSTPNGFMHECVSGGISGASAPTFATKTGAKTVDGYVVWKAVPYTLSLNTGDTITDSTWSGTNNAVLDNDAIVDSIQTKVRLTGVDAGVSSVQLTNHVTITRANGDVEEKDKVIQIKVA